MSATIHTNLTSAFRQRLLTLSKATTGSTSLSALGSVVSRAAGSFVTDGFDVGDEVVLAGFSSANNTRFCITALTSSDMTVDGTLVTDAASSGRTVVAGLPQGRAFEADKLYRPTVGQPYVSDAYQFLPSEPIGIGSNGVEGHSLAAIFGLYYPDTTPRLAISKMAGLVRKLFRPGVALYYGGESGIVMASSLSGRIVAEPGWLSATVMATAVARTIG